MGWGKFNCISSHTSSRQKEIIELPIKKVFTFNFLVKTFLLTLRGKAAPRIKGGHLAPGITPPVRASSTVTNEGRKSQAVSKYHQVLEMVLPGELSPAQGGTSKLT